MTAPFELAGRHPALALAIALFASTPAFAVPSPQEDPAGVTSAAGPSSALLPPADSGAANVPSGADALPSGPHRGNAQKDAALEMQPAEAAGSAALPRRRASTVLVDEDPRVDLFDVVESVARATSAAVPWLRLGARPHDEAARRRDGVSSESDAELALRLENGRASLAGQSSASEGDGRPAPEPGRVNLIDEAIAIARDFIANPLTWLLAVPLLLAAFMVAVLRGRGK